ncbi:hypothetical protein [Paenibacillus sp. ATY16]|uniref:hypothetical protein n=1 Tax=Paenibacillus sp. ATY16 TaxID=1759312 RepID=UPI00200C64E3|nr:hypothetical protein [Paenibacillus sp. ATY16]MCK9859031.1 hypothetical protein [Paenibacillus sp. ATY16]
MLEKIMVLIISYVLTLGTDIHNLSDAQVRSKMIYFGIIVISLYLSVDYLIKPELPDIHALVDLTLTRPARMIVEFLTVKPI